MSTLANFPELPASVGGQPIPDFLKFKVKGPVKRQPLEEKFNFAYKESPAFGNVDSTVFDEGKLWHPLHAVEFTADAATGALKSYRGHYHARSTRLMGREGENKSSLKLGKTEFVTGISGSVLQYITKLVVHTNERAVTVVSGEGGDPFEFHVPEHHHLVAFHGTETGAQVTSLGLSYQRRLQSIADNTLIGAGPTPKLTGKISTQWIDKETQKAWARNDMAPIEAVRQKASQDLLPIYANIEKNGDNAWVEVESEDKQTYYISWTTNGVIWSYAKDQSKPGSVDAASPTKDSIVSIGSYSKTTNYLGIGQYTWTNLPTQIISSLVAFGFALLLRPIIQIGVQMGLPAAAAALGQALAGAGAQSVAVLLPASVASVGGLVIAGLLGIALFLLCIALSSFLFKQYFLIFNIFNFDRDHKWITVHHHDDNSVVSKGAWEDQQIAPFSLAGEQITPPGFNPVKPLDNVVTFLNINFQNSITFLEGLGEGVVLNRDDSAAGLAVKYIVHRFADNRIGAQGIEGSGADFNVSDYYKSAAWTRGKTVQTNVGGHVVNCFTPALSGASDNTYTYMVNIGLPPAA